MFSADHKISQRTPLNAKVHQRPQIVPVPQLLAKFLNQRQNLDALNRKSRLISAQLSTAKAQHHALTVHRPAKYSDRHIGQLTFHLVINIQLCRRQKSCKKYCPLLYDLSASSARRLRNRVSSASIVLFSLLLHRLQIVPVPQKNLEFARCLYCGFGKILVGQHGADHSVIVIPA